MPTNPTSPSSNAAVDRLTLCVDSPRGAEPNGAPGAMCCMGCAACFEVESSGFGSGWHVIVGLCCFEAEASAQYCTPCCSCLETE